MARTKRTNNNTWHICHSNGYRFVIDAIVEGRENAMQIGAFIAAGSNLNTTYRARDPRHRQEIGTWDTTERARRSLTFDQIAAHCIESIGATGYIEFLESLDIDTLLIPKALMVIRLPDDSTPDGPCEITRWLDEQFKE